MTTNESTQPTANTLNDQTYAILRNALITLRYKPGKYLNTAEIMQDTNQGRTPINHALHRLSREGFIQLMPRKGALVAPLSLDEALQIIEVRLLNEPNSLALAAQHATPSDIAKLRTINEQCYETARARNIAALIDAEVMLHHELNALSKNPILTTFIDQLHARALRYWSMALSKASHADEIYQEHNSIIDALEKNDPDLAAEMMTIHIQSFKKSLFP